MRQEEINEYLKKSIVERIDYIYKIGGKYPTLHIELQATGYFVGATEQEMADHSEEHLDWIIKQHELWKAKVENKEYKLPFKCWIDDVRGKYDDL